MFPLGHVPQVILPKFRKFGVFINLPNQLSVEVVSILNLKYFTLEVLLFVYARIYACVFRISLALYIFVYSFIRIHMQMLYP